MDQQEDSKKTYLNKPDLTHTPEHKASIKVDNKNHKIPVSESIIEKLSFTERWKTSRFWIVRSSYLALFSVWAVVMGVGVVVAWVVAILVVGF